MEWDGRLNSFQRMMLRWEDLHPYNAVHVVALPESVSGPFLRDCAESVVREAGIASVEFDPGKDFFRFLPDAPPIGFVSLPGSADPLAALEGEVARQLNRPFPEGPHCPFRFFCLPGDASPPYLGLAYHHAVADARSAALLVRMILERAMGRGGGLAPAGLRRLPPTMRAAFPSELSLRRAPSLLGGILRDFLRYKRAHVPDYQSSDDPSVGFRIEAARIPLRPLRAFAKEKEVMIQDVVFAASLEALGLLYPPRDRAGRWRNRLAVATAMDLRNYASVNLDGTFGQFLGSYAVMHGAPEGIAFSSLLAEVAGQSRCIKRRRSFFGHVWSFSIMAALWPFLGENLKRSYSKWVFPLAAGISNMNLAPLLAGLEVPAYFRAASTGPIMPLLLDITTVGEDFSFTVMFRGAAFPGERVARFAARMRARLENPSGERAS